MRWIVVGGGITGLSAAWTLRKRYPDSEILLFEKKDRLGGWLESFDEEGFFFEKGPRTFAKARSPHLLTLAQEMGLPLLFSNPHLPRYLLHQKKLRSIGSLWTKWLWPCLREPFLPVLQKKEESIHEFACRRFNREMAELFFDPMTLGIYGGDCRKLSLSSCFPTLDRWEKEKGSILKGYLGSSKQMPGLFTIQGGMNRLVETLERKIGAVVYLDTFATVLSSKEIEAQGKIWKAEGVISALPPSLPSLSLWVVYLGFSQSVLKKKGYGYLVPTREKEEVLGMVFDSVIFPQQNRGEQTRLTAMLRPETIDPARAALKALSSHLDIQQIPSYLSVFFAEKALAQFPVGCGLPAQISVEDCIKRGKELAKIVKF